MIYICENKKKPATSDQYCNNLIILCLFCSNQHKNRNKTLVGVQFRQYTSLENENGYKFF